MEGAVIKDAKLVTERALKIVKSKKVTAVNGQIVKFGKVHTICVHGDTLNAVELAKSLKKALLDADVEVAPIGTFI